MRTNKEHSQPAIGPVDDQTTTNNRRRDVTAPCRVVADVAPDQSMISVIIPTLNAEPALVRTLTALVPAAVEGIVTEVIIADGGSTDLTCQIADDCGADFVASAAGRGVQLARGAAHAKSDWLLFLHADTVLEDNWQRAAIHFMRDIESGRQAPAAGVFEFRLDDRGMKPRVLEALVKARCAVFALPYGDQGLLIQRRLFDEIGGFRDMPIMEDVDIVRRLGRRRITSLKAHATTSAERFQKDGYIARMVRNQVCLALYGAGVPVQRIHEFYGRGRP